MVGNITIGGTGKTPTVYYLANYLHDNGSNPVILMRGYKSKKSINCVVPKNSDPKIFGDEPVMLANNLACPIVIGTNKAKAVQFIEKEFNPKVIICDDGLQHCALGRDLEILMIDSERYFGNLHFLPLGPLREGLEQLDRVDFIIIKDNLNQQSELPLELMKVKNISSKLYHLALKPENIYNLSNNKPIIDYSYFNLVHAVSGIGNNQRFFATLNDLGINTINHAFPDHHDYKLKDLLFNDDLPIIMTEKDAIKCKAFNLDNCWYLKVIPEIYPETKFKQHLENLL